MARNLNASVYLDGIDGEVPVKEIENVYRCRDKNGKPYLLVVFTDGDSKAIPDNEHNRSVLKGAGIDVIEMNDIILVKLGEEISDAEAKKIVVAYVCTDKNGDSYIIIVMKDGSVQKAEDNKANRDAIIGAGKVILNPRVDEVAGKVVVEEHPESEMARRRDPSSELGSKI
ncbi:hypothetical protein [Dyella agri]|uniref:VWFA domain-containing protein n=1 Tax=Dyella agri TaxID=1926869 RepID=A0ABW8KH48_9GAMM